MIDLSDRVSEFEAYSINRLFLIQLTPICQSSASALSCLRRIASVEKCMEEMYALTKALIFHIFKPFCQTSVIPHNL
jgi:hypothetical protein